MTDTVNTHNSPPRPLYQPIALQCPSCTGLLERFSEHSQLIVCGYCNERIELGHAELHALGKETPLEFSPFTLDLNSTVHWDGVDYTLIGRISFLDTDGDPGPKDYLLFHPQMGTLWATEYWGYGYYITKKSRMLPPISQLIAGETVDMPDQSKWRLTERESYRIEHVDGALPWIAKQGDQVDVIELQSLSDSQVTMAVERTMGVDEVECSISRELHRKEWRQATGQYTSVDSNTEERGTMSRVSSVSGLMLGLATLMFMGSEACSIPPAEHIALFEFTATELSTEQVTATFELPTYLDVEQPISINFKSELDNEWLSIQYAVLKSPNEDTAKTYTELLKEEEGLEDSTQNVWISDSSLSYYHGYDGGESWSEGSKSTKDRLILSEPGHYRLLLSAIGGQADGVDSVPLNRSVRINVLKKDISSAYYWVGMIFVLIVTALFVKES
jgi:hypothetical protein